MKKLSFIIISLSFLGQLNAQTPHKDLGIKESEIEYLTLSDGRYDEYHGYKDFERVGSAVIDMRTRKIAYFISRDSILDEGMFELDMTTRFITIDPMAEKFTQMSPYGYCSNNPINRIDPDGMTDFTFNKKTGAVTQVGEANDDPDRILKTNRHGEVKYRKNGDAKVAIDGLEKGILKDGQNFKTEDQIINVGGEGQPTLAGVENFVTKMGEYVGVEIAGAYLSSEKGGNAPISKVYIDEYKGNGSQQSSISLTKLYTDPSLKGMNLTTDFHTHPSNIGISRSDVERPSDADLRFRDNNRKNFYNFLILTRTAIYPYEVQSIPYTNWNK